jgi:casein kinase II subunit beta
MEDEFNLTGLSTIVPYYTYALDTILGVEIDSDQESDNSDECSSKEIEILEEDDFWNEEDKTPKNARPKKGISSEPYTFMLYGLIHQRYLLTKNGLRIMAQRYSNGQFGTCPRYHCRESHVLPVGAYDETGRGGVHLYCPKCLDTYEAPEEYKLVDGKYIYLCYCLHIYCCTLGAHFGSTYCHLLFLSYPELVPRPNSHRYQPSIFGFKVNSRSQTGPKNQWLRQRPLAYIDDEYEESMEEEDAVEVDDVKYQLLL